MTPCLFILFCFTFVHSETVLNNCIDTATGPLCLTVDTQQCFELAGTITWNGIAFGPQTVKISTLLEEVQRRTQDPNFDPNEMLCQPLSGPPLPCSFCATIDQLQISDAGTLHYCGNGQFNCSGFAPVKQNFTIPCVDINNCQLFRCRNNCNYAGQCTSVGICSCNPGYYGVDCSLLLTPSCVDSPAIPKTCWKTQFLDCRNFKVTITTGIFPVSQVYKLDEITSLPVVPCTNFINEANLNCSICVDMNNITIQGQELYGCPTIKTSCNGIAVSDNQMDCLILANTTQLICNTPSNPGPQNNTDDADSAMTSKTVLVVLVSMLAVLILVGLGYLFITRYMGLDPQKFFMDGPAQQPVTYIEDEEPLNDDDS